MKRKLLFVALPVVLLAAAVTTLLLIKQPTDTTGMAATPSILAGHADSKPVNTQAAKEIKINIPIEMDKPVVDAMPDGSILAVGSIMTYKDNNGIQAAESAKITAACYDDTGKQLWNKTYPGLVDGFVTHAKLLPGGGFVFSYNALQHYEKGQSAPHTEYLVFCNSSGEVQKIHCWYTFTLVQYLLVTDGSDIFAIGEGIYRDGKLVANTAPSNGSTDVSIMCFDAGGKLKYCRGFGGSDFDTPSGAVWSEATGLVLSVRAQSKDGDIKNANTESLKNESSVFLLAAFNEDGSNKWQNLFTGKNSYLPGQMAAGEGYITACGFKDDMLYTYRLDTDGKVLWETAVTRRTSVILDGMAKLRDGSIAVAVHPILKDNTIGSGQIILLDSNGTVLNTAGQEHFQIMNMLPTDDGGLFIVSSHNVKTLPTPLISSMIYFDTETVVTKLDGSLNVEWRKVYDKYKDSRRQDVAVPLADGSVVVER